MDEKYQIARKLRKNSTIQERKLWQLLRNRNFNNLKFKRQLPIGEYIVDFVCEEKKIIIELDGGQHNLPENIKLDNIRTEFLESKGYKVLRIWNKDFNENLDGVYTVITNFIYN